MTDLEIVRAIAAQWVSEKRTAWDALEAICKQLGIRVPESNASSVSAPTLERNGYTLTTIDGRPCILNPEGITISQRHGFVWWNDPGLGPKALAAIEALKKMHKSQKPTAPGV